MTIQSPLFEGLDQAEAAAKLRELRNITQADPSMDAAAKEREIMALNAVYQNGYGEAPAENSFDMAEQERIRGVLMDYRSELDQLRNNPSMSKEQRRAAIDEIFDRYMQEIEG